MKLKDNQIGMIFKVYDRSYGSIVPVVEITIPTHKHNIEAMTNPATLNNEVKRVYSRKIREPERGYGSLEIVYYGDLIYKGDD